MNQPNDFLQDPLIDEFENSTEFDVDSSVFSMKSWFFVALSVVILLTFVIWRSEASIVSFDLRGADVGKLQPGAVVVLSDLEIGYVSAVELRGGEPVATLSVDRKVADELPSNVRFDVGSLRQVLPGRIGVTVVKPSPTFVSNVGDEHEPRFGERRLSDIREAHAHDSILPASTPTGMYLLLGVAALVLAVGFGVSWKIASARWFRYMVIVAALAVCGLMLKGVITIEDLREWIQWAINLIRASGAPESVPNIEVVSK